ncbi:phage tail sheath C-terminal domain-containing protein [Lentilactobacillus sp. Marseille-Q4993]|uniref:phage tail sheath C-terminal domain-containing protein n=1 Tax=Lentilactobacillus sp. Marseille-Q4993 TaxID=3039492 RepID=UPI0024BD3553|nr:phage tail sheath C-terminal domain-containing protein [Lentilactobacillus sp. Marseille-Q4993]
MAGGTWTSQNKVRPGAYINTKAAAQPKVDTTLGRTLLINSTQLDWGKDGVIELNNSSDFQAALGTKLTDPKFAALRETLKGALTVLLLNANAGDKAKYEDAALPWNFEAKYAGTKGNDLTVTVEKDPSDATRITVKTIFGTELVDQQTVRTTTARALQSNEYVDVVFTGDNTEPIPEVLPVDGGAEFSVEAGKAKLEALAASTTYKLAGGTSTESDVTAKLNDALETEQYNTVTTAGFKPDDNIHKLVAQMVKRLREDEGYKVRAVLPYLEGDSYDYEGVSVVTNGVELADGTKLDTTTATGWFAGASAAAGAGKSLTYAIYPEAVSAYPRLNNEQTIKALTSGQIVFTTRRDGSVVVEQDLNTLSTFTDDKPKDFRKNQVIRTLDTIATNTQLVFETQFIGKVANDATGRGLFKVNRVSYLRDLADASVIDGFDPEDIDVQPGNDKDSILVNLAVTPTDAMEKLYMTITVH